MPIVYATHTPKQGGFNAADKDPHPYWATHCSNYFFLKKIFHTAPDFETRQQANSEMAIAERKMAYWERHPDFDRNEANRIMRGMQNRGA